MIHVIATLEIAAGQREAFLQALHELVPKVHAERGCLEYGPAIDLETNIDVQPPVRSNVVTMIEKWESLNALESHLTAPHLSEFREKVKALVLDKKVYILMPA